MQFMERARLYGQAVQILDEFLGEEIRDRVMERFSQLAGPAQRRGMKEPWEMVARAAIEAGVSNEVIRALHLVYLMRTNRWDALPGWIDQPNNAVWEHLRDWRVLAEFEKKRQRFNA